MKERIPLRISPFFFLVAGLIGWLYTRTLVGTLIWIGIIFVSVLFHEMGHAITSKFFGQSPRIELVAFGGLTYPAGKKIKKWKEFLVVLNGPLFGFLLFLFATFMLRVFPMNPQSLSYGIVKTLQIVNLFWTVVNLIPILPLDGGQLMRIVLEGIFKTRGLKIALIASMVFAIVLAFYCFTIKFLIAGILFLLFAFQNFQGFRQLRYVTTTDGDDHLKEKLQQGELAFHQGDEKQAQEVFEALMQEAKEGVIHMIAAGYLARIYARQDRLDEALNLLLPMKKELSPDGILLLHALAFQKGDDALVTDLSAPAFQFDPSVEITLRNAIAAAHLKNTKAAIGWLRTCVKNGLQDLPKILATPDFDNVRNDPHFKTFIKDKNLFDSN